MKMAILGMGRVAELHAQALNSWSPGSLAGGWNRTPEKAEQFCRAYGGRDYASLDSVLEDESVGAVLVSASTDVHFDLARKSLEAGKHVLLEKPLCKTLEQIEALQDIAQKSGRICMPSHNYIYAADMQRIHARIVAGDLGRVQSFWAFFNKMHLAEVGASDLVMRELMVHHAYSMLFFLGRPVSVSTTASNVHFTDKEADDQIMITAEFENGTIANLWGSFSADDRSREPWSVYFKVLGSQGTAMAAWDSIKFGTAREPFWDDSSYRDSFLFTQKFFLTQCVAEGASPLSTLQDSLDAAKVLNSARQSLKTGAKVRVEY